MVLMTIMDDPASGSINPIPLLKKYFSHCYPKAKLVYSKNATRYSGVMESLKLQYPDREIWYFPGCPQIPNHNVGKNTLAGWMQDLARICDAPNFEKCKNHGLRKLMITVALDRGLKPCIVADIARHSSLNSQAAYAKQTSKRRAEAAIATSSSNMAGNKPNNAKKPKALSKRIKDPTSQGKSVSDLEQSIVQENKNVINIPTYEQQTVDPSSTKMSAEEKRLLQKLLAKARSEDEEENSNRMLVPHHEIRSTTQFARVPTYQSPPLFHEHLTYPNHPVVSTRFNFDPYTGRPSLSHIPLPIHPEMIRHPPQTMPTYSHLLGSQTVPMPYAQPAPAYYSNRADRQSLGRSYNAHSIYDDHRQHDLYFNGPMAPYSDPSVYDQTYFNRHGHPHGRL
jgi:hypothetical protein